MATSEEVMVVKRDGRREPLDYNKISRRLQHLKQNMELATGRKLRVSIFRITQSTIKQIYNGITTSELDEEAAEVAAGITDDPDYGDFAGAILASNLEANNRDALGFAEYGRKAYYFVEERSREHCPLISKELFDLSQKYGHLVDRKLVLSRNLTYGYFAFKTLAKGGYLLSEYRTVQKNKMTLRTMVPFETPQHALMRVALGIHGAQLEEAFELYHYLSRKTGTMATPTLFFSGTPRPQLSSCFLLTMKDDSLSGIYDTLKDAAMISRDAGGLGLSVHDIRSLGSYIKGTNGSSNGLVPMLRVFNNTAKYVDQCFHPYTLVYTAEGPKRMADVMFNDRVVTADGSLQRVLKILHHPFADQAVWTVTTEHCGGPVTVTPAHPVWALVGQPTAVDMGVLRAHLERRTLAPEFVAVEQLQVGDWVGSPLPTFEEDAPAFSADDCRLLGLVLGHGTLNRQGRGLLRVTQGSESLAFVRQYFQQRLLALDEQPSAKLHQLCLTWHSHALFPLSYQMLRSDDRWGHNHRQLPPFLLHLPAPKLRAFLSGLLGPAVEGWPKCVEVMSCGVLHAVQYVALRLGVLVPSYPPDRLDQRLDAGDVAVVASDDAPPFVLALSPQQIRALVTGSADTADTTGLVWQGVAYSRVTALSTSAYEGPLLDFEIETQHNYVTQLGLAHNGGGKRFGSFAVYLEPWHADVLEFLDLKRPHGAEDQRARDLFYALWMPDLFFRRVETGLDTLWSLMDPKQCPGLSDVYGEQFDALYTRYEREGRFVKQVRIGQVMEAILTAQIETGTPYILSKDACNRKSNQKNLGTIKSSNLCSEIVEYSSPQETACCNLASLSLPSFVNAETREFDYAQLYATTRVFVRALNRVIDINRYPVIEAERSNRRHRPLGLGVQGLADVFCLMRLRFGNDASKRVNRRIAETMYFAALCESHALTQVLGPTGEPVGPYPSIDENGGAPIRHGLFQFDLWEPDFRHTDQPDGWRPDPELKWDWEGLRARVKKDGVRNSLLIAPMPTASTSIVLGNVESFEPYYGMIYVRSTKSGEFYQMCRPLVEELIRRDLWKAVPHPDTGQSFIPLKDQILLAGGSIQTLPNVPDDLKEVFVCITDLKLKDLTDMARDRGVFTDQSMSLNVHFRNKDDLMPDLLHYMLYAWKLGLKTISYYTRTIQTLSALNFTGKSLKEEAACTVCSA